MGALKQPTISASRFSKTALAIGQLLWPEPSVQPKRRGECGSVPRPCPHVACRYNTLVSVTEAGSLRMTWGDREIWDVDAPSCALDVADCGGHSLEEIGDVLNMTRERVRQIEAGAMAKLRLAFQAGLAAQLEDIDNERADDGVRGLVRLEVIR